MGSSPAFDRGGGRSRFLIGLAAAVLFLAIWTPLHPARPQGPQSDLYTHLSVARHLCRGEGFRSDLAYPLSFAYPFARELPQPLIHRTPGYPLLLTLPHLLGGGEPARVIARVRRLQLLLLALIAGIGAAAWAARGRRVNAVPWLILLGANPLLAYAVDWGFVELACGLLLLVLWLRSVGSRGAAKGWTIGILTGVLALLRPELSWLPGLWWLARRPGNQRALFTAAAVFLLLQVPWAVRTQRLAGNPFFSLQGQAELVKDTRTWPGYSVYRQLEPQPPGRALREIPVPILRKAARGMKFQLLNLRRLIPGWYWLGLLALGIAGAIRTTGSGRRRFPCGPDPARRGRDGKLRLEPLPLLAVSLGLLMVQYAVFDASLRHLLVLTPVLLWELADWTGATALQMAAGRPRLRYLAPEAPAAIPAAAALTFLVLLVFPLDLPGWRQAEAEARAAQAWLPELVVLARQSTDTVLFVEYSAVPYLADRPAVWAPEDPRDQERIRELLAAPRSGAVDLDRKPDPLTDILSIPLPASVSQNRIAARSEATSR